MPDDSLYLDSSVDPLGFRVIWSYFGQKIFNYKLTTISTDIRNFNINLFHHHIIHDLFVNHPEIIDKAKNKFKTYLSEYDIKTGLIIFLEDLITYSLIYQSHYKNNRDIDMLGILGSYKAEQNFVKNEGNIILEAEKSKGVLIRQILLGVNGRYKGPFINMGLFTRNFQYTEPEWIRVGKIIDSWGDGRLLAKRLIDIILNLIEEKTGEYPKDNFNNYKDDEELQSLIINCFKQRKTIPELKLFWEDKLGLKQGAVWSIYHQFDDQAIAEKTPRIVFEKASQEENDKVEKMKIENILKLEPFLSICSQIFYSITDNGVKEVSSIEKDIEKLRQLLQIEDVKLLTKESPRLQELVIAISSGETTARGLMKTIVSYHEKIMRDRGGNSWVELKEGTKIKHYIYQSPIMITDKFIQERPWYNNYYLDTVRNIRQGLN